MLHCRSTDQMHLVYLWNMLSLTLEFFPWYCLNLVAHVFFLVPQSFNNILALRADVSEILVSWASRLRDFLGEVSSLAPILSNLSSVSTVRFLSGFLSSSDPVLFSLLTKLCILCLLGTGSPGNWHRNFLRHFPADSYLKYSSTKYTRCSIVYLTRAMLLKHWMFDWERHYQKQINTMFHGRSPTNFNLRSLNTVPCGRTTHPG